jgi:hypothetical protein
MLKRRILPIITSLMITFFVPLNAMQEKKLQKSYCITTYTNDHKKNLVPLFLVRESNVLYEKYCRKVSENRKRLFLNAPLDQENLVFFVDAFSHKPGTKFKNYYKTLDCPQRTQLMHVAGLLKSPWAKAQIIDCYVMSSDIKNLIGSFLMQSAAECIRYCRIKLYAQSQLSFFQNILPSKDLTIPQDQWEIASTSYGKHHVVPSCVIHNGVAMWDGKMWCQRTKENGSSSSSSSSSLVSSSSSLSRTRGQIIGVHAIQCNADNSRFLTIEYGKRDTSMMIVWNSYYPYNEIKRITRKGHIRMACFNHLGDRIVTMMRSGECCVYDGYTGKRIKKTERLENDHGYVSCGIVFSNDNRLFMTMLFRSYYLRNHFTLWDVKTGEKIGDLSSAAWFSYGGGFTPNLQHIITADIKEVAQGGINSTELYDDNDAQEIEQIVSYKPEDLFSAYCVWRSCKAAENGHVYNRKQLAMLPYDIQLIISASVLV